MEEKPAAPPPPEHTDFQQMVFHHLFKKYSPLDLRGKTLFTVSSFFSPPPNRKLIADAGNERMLLKFCIQAERTEDGMSDCSELRIRSPFSAVVEYSGGALCWKRPLLLLLLLCLRQFVCYRGRQCSEVKQQPRPAKAKLQYRE